MLEEVAEEKQELDLLKIRSDFPILNRKVHGKRLVYLDNAATTQKPRQVIDSITDYYTNHNANIHRSVHVLAEEATESFEEAREKARHFVKAGSTKEIIFTKNATEALNLAARCCVERYTSQGDRIVVTEMEHHSDFVPWQQLSKNKDLDFQIANVDNEGHIDLEDLEEKLEDAKLFAFTHMSNVLGTINDAKRLVKIAHDKGAIVVVDGAQSAPHIPIDVNEMDCDLFALSAHKMLGPTGVGVLYGKKKILEELPPFLWGGDMIKQVHREETEWNELPWKYEAGTSNIADVIAFGCALDYLENLGMNRVAKHEQKMTKQVLEEMSKVPEIKMYGPSDYKERGAVFSFNLGDIHAHDVASILDSEGVAIRSGHHCAQILMEKLGVPATSRASFYLYNGEDDLDSLCSALRKVKEVLA
jgi:cysteine desulfurase / selenocysteine lyase